MPLTDAAVRAAKPREKAYKMADGQGMYLQVTPSGAKYWRLKYRVDGKERVHAIGVYPTVSLLAARKARDAIKDQIRGGLDPSHEKRRVKLEAGCAARTRSRRSRASGMRRNVRRGSRAMPTA